MSSGPPTWYMILQLAFTLMLGLGAGAIAWMQWRTAHQKVLLDLFDRRIAVVEGARQAIGAMLREGPQSTEAVSGMYAAARDAEFLFGPDFTNYVRALASRYDTINWLERRSNHLPPGPERDKVIEKQDAVLGTFADDFTRLSRLAAPYVRLHDKAVPTPADFIRERNRLRSETAE